LIAYNATVFNIVSQLFNHAKLCSVISGIDGESGRHRWDTSENLSPSCGRTAKRTPGPAVTTGFYLKMIPIPLDSRGILPLPLPCSSLLQVQEEEEELSWKPADPGSPGKTSVKWKHWHQAPNWLDIPPVRHKMWHTLHLCSSRRALGNRCTCSNWWRQI